MACLGQFSYSDVNTDHALDVFTDPSEPPNVAGDESEGDGVEASRWSLGGGHRGKVDLHSNLQILFCNFCTCGT